MVKISSDSEDFSLGARPGTVPRQAHAHREMRTGSHLSSNPVVELTSDNLRGIESAVSKIPVQGARYQAHMQQRVGR